ncbi:hypothetical protein D7V93_01475 [Corallococcus llansteffanensis]|uniref:Uncharacterized protein n=1 Tax=Corallococcus llansteffanensis TaxID=2316731 RepID=A0A3A8QHS2_9BACT|nr:hypothetical protein D7V93_01475 [Corallococcus llansteffanensis]
MGICLSMMVVLLAGDAPAVEPGASLPGRIGALRLGGLDGKVLRVQLEPGASRLVHPLSLDETANAPVSRARLLVTGLRDESGAQVSPLSVVGADGQALQEHSVEPGGSVPLKLEADIPAPGTYEATLTLLQEGAAPSSARLVFSRPRPALNVGVDVAPVRGNTPLFGGPGEATLQFTLHEKEGRPVILSPPVLARLVLQEDGSEDAALQVLADASVLDAKGQPIEVPFVLDRRMTLPLRLRLSGLPGPGRYEGTLRVSAADAPAVDLPFVLYLREHALVAFLIIALGVVLSFLVRKYVAHERPRMVLQHRVLGLARALEELKASPAPSSRDQELLACVMQEVDAVLADVSGRAVLGGIGGRLDLLERKVACTRNWLRLRRAIDEMRPADLRAEPQARLGTVERSLREPRTTSEDLSIAETTLAGLPSELDARMRQHLSERLALFRAELHALASAPSSELALQLELQVGPRLDKVGELLDQDLRSAFEELDAARLAQASVLAERLAESLRTPAPSWIGHDAWVSLRDKVTLLLKPLREVPPPSVEAAVAAYESGLTRYLMTLGRALTDQARTRLQRVGEEPPEQRKGWQQVLDTAERVQRCASERKLPESMQALDEARSAFEEVSSLREAPRSSPASAALDAARGAHAAEGAHAGPMVSFSSPETQDDGIAQPAEEVLPSLFEEVRLFVPRLEGTPPAEGRAQLERQLATLDLLVLVLVLGMAALSGMKVLWMEAPAWGGLNDRLLAFMWGFGVHQVSHSGLANLLGRSMKQEPPAPP